MSQRKRENSDPKKAQVKNKKRKLEDDKGDEVKNGTDNDSESIQSHKNQKQDSQQESETSPSTSNDITNQNNKKPSSSGGTKVDWEMYKKQKKELKMKRKQNKGEFSELIAEARKLYVALKSKQTKDKVKLSTELHGMLNNDNIYHKFVMARETSRIVQCLLKYSVPAIRNEISEMLLPIIIQMSMSKYGHFCVNRMIKCASTDVRNKIIHSLYGNIVKLVSHTYSADVIDNIFLSWANSDQKAFMCQEFYGDLYKMSKNNEVKCIADTYKKSPHMKTAVLNAVKANLNHCVNKKLVDNSVIHTVLLDYLNESKDADKTEIITAYAPFIPSLCSTRNGVHASISCFWLSITKDRRAIVKTIKEHLVRLCTHEHGHIFIMALINCLDDTKLIKKSIFDNIIEHIEQLAMSEWGRKIVQWFVAPDDTSLFHPKLLEFLENGQEHSKKDMATRRSEILQAVEEPLSNAICKNPEFWLRGGHTALTTAAIIKAATGNPLKLIYDNLAKIICNRNWEVTIDECNYDKNKKDEKQPQPSGSASKKKIKPEKQMKVLNVEKILGVEHAGLHIALKKISKMDKEKHKQGFATFGEAIVATLTSDTLDVWLPVNRSSFLLINLYENGTKETRQKMKDLLTEKRVLLTEQKHVAAKLLLEKLNLK